MFKIKMYSVSEMARICPKKFAPIVNWKKCSLTTELFTANLSISAKQEMKYIF